MLLADWLWVYLCLLPTALLYRHAVRHLRASFIIYDRLLCGWLVVWPFATHSIVLPLFAITSQLMGGLPAQLLGRDELIHLSLAALGIGFIGAHAVPEGKGRFVCGVAIATTASMSLLCIPSGPLQLLAIVGWYLPFSIGMGRAVSAQGRITPFKPFRARRDIAQTETGLGMGSAGWDFERSQIDRHAPALMQPRDPPGGSARGG